MTRRPPRRVPHGITHTWDSQAHQYKRDDIPRIPGGITYWQVPADEAPVPIHCLLAWDGHPDEPKVIGILNYYPEGSPFGEEPHDFLILVHPLVRRGGVGRELVRTALETWPAIDLMNQAYTDAGWALAKSILEGK